ncbi:MAG: hypothetical protein J0M20_06340 [Burkholderiales bacterium]|nr:hypothetical protein [Burkholderiales bacterium]
MKWFEIVLSGARCALLSLAAVALLPAPALAATTPKKGLAIGTKLDGDGSKLARMHVHWYYNWTLKPNHPQSADCFVPMYWGKKGQLATLKTALEGRKPPLLLTFNEPDFKNQANRSIDEVLAEWPELVGLGVPLSAPTAARPMDAWMRDFMRQAGQRRLSMAAVPVHWYGGPDVDRFIEFIEKVHQQYQRPLWITEFAVADWHSTKYGSINRFTEDDVVAFVRKALPRLDALPYVERYSWLAADTDKESLRPSLLFTDDGKLTRVGLAYAMHGYDKDFKGYCGDK